MRRAAWKNAALAVALGSASVGAIANPYDWSVRALVTGIEVTYVPNEILFSLDASAGPCAAGSWLRYLPMGAEAVSKASNAKAVLAVLLAAKTSGQHVLVFGGNQGCQARFVYIN